MNTKKEDLEIFEQEQGELIMFVKTHDLTNQDNYKKFKRLQDINMEIMKIKLDIKMEELNNHFQ